MDDQELLDLLFLSEINKNNKKPKPNDDGTFGTPPDEMVYDPVKQIFVDTALAAERMPTGTGAGLQVLKGVPGVRGYVDEIMGAAVGGGDDVQRRIATQTTRELDKQFRGEYPKTSMGLNMGGGAMATANPLIRFATNPRTTLFNKMVKGGAGGLLLGGTEGAIAGSGDADGPGGTSGNRVQGAQREGFMGGLIGTPLGITTPVLGSAVRTASERAIDAITQAGKTKAAKELGVGTDAVSVLGAAVQGDDIDKGFKNIKEGGDGAMLADAGPATAGVLDTVMQTIGPAARIASDKVTARANETLVKMNKTLDNILGMPQGKSDLTKKIGSETKQQRSEEYLQAYGVPIDYASKTGVALTANVRRINRSVFAAANELLEADGGQKIIFKVVDDKVELQNPLNVEQWDYITRGLRQKAASLDGQGLTGGQTDIGRAWENLSLNIRDNLKKAVPEYKTALETASDTIGRVQSVNKGYDLLSATVKREDALKYIKNATGPELAAMKSGLRQKIDDTLANVTKVVSDPDMDAKEAKKALQMLTSRSSLTKLNALLGGKDMAKLAKELKQAERALSLKANVAQNSKTFGRTTANEMIDEFLQPNALQNVARLRPVEAVGQIASVLTNQTDEALNLKGQKIRAEIADVLTRQDNAGRYLYILDRLGQRLPITEAQARSVADAFVKATTTPAYLLSSEKLKENTQ